MSQRNCFLQVKSLLCSFISSRHKARCIMFGIEAWCNHKTSHYQVDLTVPTESDKEKAKYIVDNWYGDEVFEMLTKINKFEDLFKIHEDSGCNAGMMKLVGNTEYPNWDGPVLFFHQ
ncbi:hypothetical protein M8J77_014586 [Diaphorina citri]|nr:hypothetical protein M8J77_014586 [Diaphorina citri]